jgi:spore coat polysaccharide biosynthesis predicted glycosyltransferase SpsG
MNKNFQKSNKKIRVLIAPTPITQLQGYDTTEIHIRFKNTIKNIILKLQDKNIELIFKIHPSQSDHNNEIRKIIETYSKKSSIYLFNPVKELIQTCDVIITITPEGWAPSTIMLESMILGKPALNIILDGKVYDFEYIKQNAAVATSYDSIDEILSNLIDNSEYRKKIGSNALLFSKQFLCNYGNSSKKIANFLTNKKQINA